MSGADQPRLRIWIPDTRPGMTDEKSGSRRSSNVRQAVEVGVQSLGNGDAAALVLVVLQQRHQGAAHGQARAIERVHEARALLAGRLGARIHSPCLEVAAVGARADLAVAVLARQPDL